MSSCGSSGLHGAAAVVVVAGFLGLLVAVDPVSKVCLNKTPSPSHPADLFSFPASLLPNRDMLATDALRLLHRPCFPPASFPWADPLHLCCCCLGVGSMNSSLMVVPAPLPLVVSMCPLNASMMLHLELQQAFLPCLIMLLLTPFSPMDVPPTLPIPVSKWSWNASRKLCLRLRLRPTSSAALHGVGCSDDLVSLLNTMLCALCLCICPCLRQHIVVCLVYLL